MAPLISIVIPVYNLEGYIEKTLDSVFAQTYRNIEVIAVNDGSADKTAEMLDRYAEKESRLHVIHKENGGVTSARICGIKVASGDYIGFVDGDDLIDCDMFERLVNNAIKYDADISHCGYRVTNKDTVRYFYNTGRYVVQKHDKGIIDLLEGKFIDPGLWNKLYKRQLFTQLLNSDKLDESIVINEDLLMNYFLFDFADRSVYEDFCPYNYIKREGSASQSDARLMDFQQPIQVRQIILDYCKNTEFEDLAKKIYLSKTLHYLASLDNREEFRKFKSDLRQITAEYYSYVRLLPKKQQISAFMVVHMPKIFNFLVSLIKNK